MEECWDDDAEARISSVCAEERTREMSSFWDTRFKGTKQYCVDDLTLTALGIERVNVVTTYISCEIL